MDSLSRDLLDTVAADVDATRCRRDRGDVAGAGEGDRLELRRPGLDGPRAGIDDGKALASLTADGGEGTAEVELITGDRDCRYGRAAAEGCVGDLRREALDDGTGVGSDGSEAVARETADASEVAGEIERVASDGKRADAATLEAARIDAGVPISVDFAGLRVEGDDSRTGPVVDVGDKAAGKEGATSGDSDRLTEASRDADRLEALDQGSVLAGQGDEVRSSLAVDAREPPKDVDAILGDGDRGNILRSTAKARADRWLPGFVERAIGGDVSEMKAALAGEMLESATNEPATLAIRGDRRDQTVGIQASAKGTAPSVEQGEKRSLLARRSGLQEVSGGRI